MPTTRSQAAKKTQRNRHEAQAEVGEKHDIPGKADNLAEEPPVKKVKTEGANEPELHGSNAQRIIGTTERGHIYFFYRPRVQVKEAHSIDEVKNLHMLLQSEHAKKSEPDSEMKILQPGADAVPAPAPLDDPRQHFRLITIGKKQLPDTNAPQAGKRGVFWATVTSVGDDLQLLEKGLGEKSYQTKTRGIRHEEPARLVARGVYAIVNNDPRVPSQREAHLGYHISHPAELGDVQVSLGIHKAASYGPRQAHGKGADYPDHILRDVFGKGTKGRESYGLRFTSCETPELLDYEGAELLLIAARKDDADVETSLGEGRGDALDAAQASESNESVQQVFRELGMDVEVFPTDAIEGHWI
ncbi:hypothetical protein BD779DRAFT_1611599 [Infundibulicybe gibba]|nr:hypothetical protein BD779DRAFT_1611599 [Infundibulicybe gibba]